MTSLCMLIAMEACSITCAVFAGLLAYHERPGWGWFLLIAALTTVTNWKPKDKDKQS